MTDTDYQKKLRGYIRQKKLRRKTLNRSELEEAFSVSSDEDLFAIISQLEKEGVLQPKGEETNGNRKHRIYRRYWVRFPQDTHEEELKEIATLHPLLQTSGYLQRKPEVYKRYRSEFRLLDRYLFSRPANAIPISRKERSFEIFNEEKRLDDTAFFSLLNKLGFNQEVLRFYDTPEDCFNDFILERRSPIILLICENKDIWFNLRRVMYEDQKSELFGIRLNGIVYGCGNKVTGKEALTRYSQFMGASDAVYFYWGDIDRAGLNIYLGAVKNNPELDIRLFIPAYEEMLRLAKGRIIPDSDDDREIMGDYSEILASTQEQYRKPLETYIKDNKRIPQEIISYAFLKDNMR